MRTFVLSVVIGFFSMLAVNAQHAKPTIKFDKTIHDFGVVQEDKGTVNVVFEFTNAGGQPLVVHNVQASCGCTTPEWSRNPIPPGGKGTVKVTFDPKNRPGNFNKMVTISSNSQNANVVLRVTGNVTARAQTVEDIYPYVMGPLRVADTHLALTKIAPGAKKSEQLKLVNTSDKPVMPEFLNVPSHISVKVVPETLKPGEVGVLVAEYDAAKKDDWGFVVDQVFLIFDKVKDYKNRITISATIEEDFGALTEAQMQNAPVITIENKTFDFGEIKSNQKVEHAFIVKNDGKSNLIIRKVKASCGCTAINPKKSVLVPGESTEITAIFDPTGKSGRQNKSVTIITNDPKSSNVMLRITGNIVD